MLGDVNMSRFRPFKRDSYTVLLTWPNQWRNSRKCQANGLQRLLVGFYCQNEMFLIKFLIVTLDFADFLVALAGRHLF